MDCLSTFDLEFIVNLMISEGMGFDAEFQAMLHTASWMEKAHVHLVDGYWCEGSDYGFRYDFDIHELRRESHTTTGQTCECIECLKDPYREMWEDHCYEFTRIEVMKDTKRKEWMPSLAHILEHNAGTYLRENNPELWVLNEGTDYNPLYEGEKYVYAPELPRNCPRNYTPTVQNMRDIEKIVSTHSPHDTRIVRLPPATVTSSI